MVSGVKFYNVSKILFGIVPKIHILLEYYFIYPKVPIYLWSKKKKFFYDIFLLNYCYLIFEQTKEFKN